MYYEEKFINGKLMYRHMPDADWIEQTTAVAIVANQVMKLSNEGRKELFKLFNINVAFEDVIATLRILSSDLESVASELEKRKN